MCEVSPRDLAAEDAADGVADELIVVVLGVEPASLRIKVQEVGIVSGTGVNSARPVVRDAGLIGGRVVVIASQREIKWGLLDGLDCVMVYHAFCRQIIG